ncbi:MAG: hypothetical protein QF629_08495 [Alphaproteobacteria bacterium]|jgi:hypothetical protein|nr:hypothetical protein [Alphaproteobacteria bacterium]MDP6239426.1 hypothetical protein [Alphaproteobacteria bacterium]
MHVLRYIKIVILLVTSRISVVFADDNAEVEALAKQIFVLFMQAKDEPDQGHRLQLPNEA